ncbi:hypothetical protein Q9L58_009742 [Maublancomyces gigas]|uniref:GIY-YIG homing endonuclease n=1 Tax=Discina gigas TaxID=1032678 RepID=A0ABR3G651_9PEZI
MTITAIKPTTQSPEWYDINLAPCPIQNPTEFENNLRFASQLRNPKHNRPIYLEMINPSYNNLWNGIGTSHAVEIVHQALIHPESPTNTVFASAVLKSKLLLAIRTFFEIAKSPEYLQRVPANGTSQFAFEFSPAVTRYINEQFTKAYRKSTTLLSYTDYNTLQTQGLLAPEFLALEKNWEQMMLSETGREKKKRVPVYTIELRGGKQNKGKIMEYEDADEEEIEEKKGKLGRARYTYTCIFKQSGAKLGKVYSTAESELKKRQLEQTGKRAEIGIASFMDPIREIQERKKATAKTTHKGSIKTGKVGRPIKRQKCDKDLQL